MWSLFLFAYVIQQSFKERKLIGATQQRKRYSQQNMIVRLMAQFVASVWYCFGIVKKVENVYESGNNSYKKLHCILYKVVFFKRVFSWLKKPIINMHNGGWFVNDIKEK